MIRKIIFLLLVVQLACSVPPPADDEIILPAALMLKPADLDQEDIGMVSGVLFEVENFDMWMSAYEKAAEGLLIAFRNVDDPDMTLVFEGSKSKAVAEGRVDYLTSEDFLSASSAFDDPLTSYYRVEYLSKTKNPPEHFVALSYATGGDPDIDFISFVKDNQVYFEELGIEAAGIGTNPENREQAYILFRQFDFVSFRKSMNSPRKINKLLDKLRLPEHTLISYWVRISQPAD